MKTYDRIEINPNIMFGKPVIKGTRLTVEQILRKLRSLQPTTWLMRRSPSVNGGCIEIACRRML
jgi:hypothetical protein